MDELVTLVPFINSDGLKELSLEGKELYRVPDAVAKLTDVEVLNLSNNNLTGLPHDICHLFKLKTLLLRGNEISEFPIVICQLTKLVKLDVSDNQLTKLPINITKLQQLQELYLSSNRLGELPEVICQLKKLTKLSLSSNKLTSISGNISKLEQLQELVLSNNRLEGELPVGICQLRKLIKLYLSHNKLTTISDQITTLELLEVLDLSYNSLGGELPKVICQLKKLIMLSMSSNHLTSTPDNITQLEQLQVLVLSNNKLGELPHVICQLKNLTKLIMSSNQLTSIPDMITQLKQLQVLVLSDNKLEGDLSTVICQLTNLIKLDMSSNQLTSISYNITKLEQLQELNLSNNGLGVLPVAVCQLKKLTSLNLSSNQLTTLSDNITQLERLQVLDLSNNRLRKMPEAICHLTKLLKLDMSSNQLTSILDNITKLERLQELNLSNNSLEELQEVVCQFTKLIKLDMSSNKLTSISNNITKLEQLQELHLSYNKLGGKLPEAICQLKKLIKLSMSRNQLTSIPDNITQLEQLQVLNLSDNNLEELPARICQLKGLNYLMVNGNPLKVPPVVICTQGLPAIRTYFLDVRLGKTRHCKLVLLGSSGAGKTSLAKTLMNNRPSCVQNEDRTKVVDRIPWEIEAEGEIMNISITDFGGNHLYKIVHHLFLDENALILLVVNLARYDKQIFNKEAGSWLNVLMSRVPKAEVFLVGTQIDIDCLGNEERIRLRKMEVLEDVSCFVKKVSDQSDLFCFGKKLSDQSDRFKDMITVSSETFQGMEDLRTLVLHFVSTNGQVIPSNWSEIYSDLKNSKITREQPFLTFNAVKDLVRKKSKEKGLKRLQSLLETKERRAESVLSFFHDVGALLWYEHSDELKKFVFHKADFLVQLMKAVFPERRSAELLTYQESFKKQFSSISFQEAKDGLLKTGIMSCDFLHCLWNQPHLEEELLDALTKLFVHLDLCYPMNQDVCQSPLRFPWFLTQEAPETQVVKMMMHSRPPRGSHRLSLKYMYPAMCPEPLYHIFVVRLHRNVHDIKSRQDWKDGVYARIKETQVLVHRSHEATETVISVSAEGPDLVEVWTVLLSCHEELTGVMSEWPGIRWGCWIVCPHCTRFEKKDHGHFPATNLDKKCPKGRVTCDCHDERIPACLVYPVGESDLSRHQKVLEEYTNQLVDDGFSLPNSRDSEQMTSFMTGSPSSSPVELSLLAQEACPQWKALGKQLGIPNADLQQIEADNQRVYEQCYIMLKRWTQVHASPPTYVELGRALQSKPVDRGDLAVKYCSMSGAHESREVSSPIMDVSYKNGEPTEEEILSLVQDVQEHWKQLARALKLEDSVLNEIDCDRRELFEKTYAMLSKWKQVEGKAATYRNLAKGLERVGRRDLIGKFCCKRKIETDVTLQLETGV